MSVKLRRKGKKHMHAGRGALVELGEGRRRRARGLLGWEAR